MNRTTTRRKLCFALSLASAVLLSGCGGGGGGGTEPDLSAAYDAITQGMTYAQVRDVVGYEYNAGRNGSASEVTYSWTDKAGTAATQFLSVAFNAQDQSVFKSIQVKGGRSDSQSWK